MCPKGGRVLHLHDEKLQRNPYGAHMDSRQTAHPVSEMIARDAGRFLTVIDHVLALNYLRPELRRRVVKLQRDLIRAEMVSHYHGVEDGEG